MNEPADLAEFLTARIAEDYEAAQAACRHWERPEVWSAEKGGTVYDLEDSLIVNGKVLGKVSNVDRQAADHIARHDPARALSECEAKRQIVSLRSCCRTADADQDRCPTLRALALPYADHPDYQQEWKP